MRLKRRDFIKLSLCSSAYLLGKNLVNVYALTDGKEALYYKRLDHEQVQCLNCPHQCLIKKGERGFCRIRENINGELRLIVYAKPCAVHIDAIEKKPFFHVLPGTQAFSIATAGCNLRCKFCQNWQISQATPEQVQGISLSGYDIAKKAKQSNCLSIAYTYTEPMVFYEFALDTSMEAKKLGIINVMHSNGFVNPAPLRRICDNLVAINVDLKGFTQTYYQNICSATLQNVLDNLIIIKKEKCVWLELTNLLIPSLNDDPEDIKQMCNWVFKFLGPDVPIHFSRFFPMYKLANLPPTPVSSLETARKIALDAGMQYVYIGNLPGHPGENTYCPSCDKMLIERSGYTILQNLLQNGKCRYCNQDIPGVWT